MVTITRQAAHRLADIDVEQHIVVDGVKLIRAASGRYYAESRSAPGTLWFLTGFSCQCPSFVHRQACRHHRALLKALGWRQPESTPAASTTCGECHGAGSVPATIGTGAGTWAYGSETCWTCHGAGALAAAA